jgi:hypothetical protein
MDAKIASAWQHLTPAKKVPKLLTGFLSKLDPNVPQQDRTHSFHSFMFTSFYHHPYGQDANRCFVPRQASDEMPGHTGFVSILSSI